MLGSFPASSVNSEGRQLGQSVFQRSLRKNPNLFSFLRIMALLLAGEKGGLCGAVLGLRGRKGVQYLWGLESFSLKPRESPVIASANVLPESSGGRRRCLSARRNSAGALSNRDHGWVLALE